MLMIKHVYQKKQDNCRVFLLPGEVVVVGVSVVVLVVVVVVVVIICVVGLTVVEARQKVIGIIVVNLSL